MKKLRSLLAFLLVITFTFSFVNCVDDDDDDDVVDYSPILTIVTSFSGYTVQAWRGEQFSFSVTAAVNESSESKLSTLELSVVDPGEDWDTTYTINANSFTLNYAYTVPTDVQDGNSITVTFKLTDKDGETKTKAYVMNIVDPADVNTYDDVELGAQSNATLGSFFASTTGVTYLVADAKNNQQLIDWIYIYDTKATTYTAVFVSPDNTELFGTNNASQYPVYDVHEYTIRNSTSFRQITDDYVKTEFDNLTSAQLEDKYNNNSNTAKDKAPYLFDINSSSKPSYYAFKTGNGKYGVFIVQEITDYSSSGSIIIDVKVQK